MAFRCSRFDQKTTGSSLSSRLVVTEQRRLAQAFVVDVSLDNNDRAFLAPCARSVGGNGR